MDFSAALTAALSTAVDDFQTNLTAIIPAVLGIAVATLIYRRVKGLVR